MIQVHRTNRKQHTLLLLKLRQFSVLALELSSPDHQTRVEVARCVTDFAFRPRRLCSSSCAAAWMPASTCKQKTSTTVHSDFGAL